VTSGGRELLTEHLPAGTELDDFHGENYVSIVAFQFQKTRILGVPMPFYRDFAEINLRFYVRRKVDGTWRRGVVFIKEVVPYRLPALIANKIFKENFHVCPLSCNCTHDCLRYQWTEGGANQRMETQTLPECHKPEKGSLTEHVIDHYWAYKQLDETTTGEFEVKHRPWRVHDCLDAKIDIDLLQAYGGEWADVLDEKPVSVFFADGSRVGVTKPEKLHFHPN